MPRTACKYGAYCGLLTFLRKVGDDGGNDGDQVQHSHRDVHTGQFRHANHLDAVERFGNVPDLERSVSIYNSAVRTGNETLDIVLTDKRLHCASHNIQFTCIADGSGVAFMETMDIFSLFGNILDNAIECESLQPPEMRFIHLSVRTVNRMLTIHAENHFEDSLQFKDGLPVTTKADKDSHGYGMMSVRHIVEKYNGSFSISTQDKLFQIDIIMPIPCDDTGRSAG